MCFRGCLSFWSSSGRRRCCSAWPAWQAAERLRFSCRSGGFTFCSAAATSALRTGLQVNDAVLSSRGRPDSPSASASPSDLRMDDADIAAEKSKTTAVAAKGEKRRQLTSVRGSLKNKILLRLASKAGGMISPVAVLLAIVRNLKSSSITFKRKLQEPVKRSLQRNLQEAHLLEQWAYKIKNVPK